MHASPRRSSPSKSSSRGPAFCPRPGVTGGESGEGRQPAPPLPAPHPAAVAARGAPCGATRCPRRHEGVCAQAPWAPSTLGRGGGARALPKSGEQEGSFLSTPRNAHGSSPPACLCVCIQGRARPPGSGHEAGSPWLGQG